MRTWRTLSFPLPEGVVAARIELHHAAQIVSVAGRSYIPAREDDSHSAFEWLDEFACLAGFSLNESGIRVALRPASLELCIIGGAGILASRSLSRRTIAEAMVWLRTELSGWGLDATRLSPAKPYELAPHALTSGGRFELAHPAAFEDLARQWGNADLILREIAAREPSASPVRCWPHHFDIATLISEGGERTIGVGLSPGDDVFSDPYFYVTPHPSPSTIALPSLPSGGHWNTKPWVGAILLSAEVAARVVKDKQRSAAEEFLSSAVDSCRGLFV